MPYIMIMIVTTLLISPQLINHATFLTSDRLFHFSRFYDALQQIQTGNYNYFQMNYSFGESGRVINAAYGPFFAYLNGLILGICRSWFVYAIVMDYIVYLIAGMGLFRLARKVQTPYWTSILLSIVYLTIGILPGWLRANNFMAWGSALAPYVIILGIDMVQNKQKPISVIKLMLVMSLLAQIHLLSTIILTIALVPFAIIGFINTPNKKEMVKDLALAIGGTLILTANVWGALLELTIHNQMALPKAFKLSSTAMRLSYKRSEHSHLLISLSILFVLQLIYASANCKRNKLNFLLTIWGMVLLLLASKLMPWSVIQHSVPMLSRSFQFPYRLTVAAYPLLLAGMGITISELVSNRKLKLLQPILYLCLAIVAVQASLATLRTNGHFTNIYNNPKRVIAITTYSYAVSDRVKFRDATHSDDLGQLLTLFDKSQADYLPDDGRPSHSSSIRKQYQNEVLNQANNYVHYVKNGNLYLKWHSSKSGRHYLPLVMYQESSLKVNNKNIDPIKLSNVGAPLIKDKKGWNVAELSFRMPTGLYLCIFGSLIAWIILLLYGIRMLYKKQTR